MAATPIPKYNKFGFNFSTVLYTNAGARLPPTAVSSRGQLLNRCHTLRPRGPGNGGERTTRPHRSETGKGTVRRGRYTADAGPVGDTSGNRRRNTSRVWRSGRCRSRTNRSEGSNPGSSEQFSLLPRSPCPSDPPRPRMPSQKKSFSRTYFRTESRVERGRAA